MAVSPEATIVTVLVPLHPPHGCRLCLPIPQDYSDHAGLVKHLKHVHGTSLLFECRACELVLDQIKRIKLHQQKSEICRNSIAAALPPLPLPPNRKKICIPTRPRKKYSPRKRWKTALPQASDSDFSEDKQPQLTTRASTSRTRRRTRPAAPPSPEDHDKPASPTVYAPAWPRRSVGSASSPTYAEVLATSQSATCTPPALNNLQPRVVLSRTDVPLLSTPTGQLSQQASKPPPASFSSRFRSNPLHQPASSTSPSPPPDNCTPSLEHADEVSIPTRPPSQSPSLSQPSQTSTSTWIKAWVQRFNSAVDEDMLENMLDDLTHLRQGEDGFNASYIQKTYRINRKKAFDIVQKGGRKFCGIHLDVIEEHFRSVFSDNNNSRTQVPIRNVKPPPVNNDPLSFPFTPEEVAIRLQKGKNTAPGPDNIRYHHWRKLDPGGHILSAVFNAVNCTGHIPQAWKCSTTILAYKKGDPSDIGNWRPITLSATLSKLYTACLADRLLRWCTSKNCLSPAQKGFMSYEGCLDHNFCLQTIIQDARRSRKECYLSWLDFANAFGSIPHSTIWSSLKWLGLHQDSIDLIQNLYDNYSTRIRTNAGYLQPITVNSGIRQGCPISPILFNLTLEVGIRMVESLDLGYTLHDHSFGILAYADDVVLVSSSQPGLKSQLDSLLQWADWASISLNAKKCACLSILSKEHTTGPLSLSINETAILMSGPTTSMTTWAF
ncbi:uncharacterized protein [Centruroides vittatus]|uniref:uncharacterized protein n=1 Tax=Centruroides vittatus TaxID=120091 RepID=UPI00350FA063